MTVEETYWFYFTLFISASVLMFLSEIDVGARIRIIGIKRKISSVNVWSLVMKLILVFIISWPLLWRNCSADLNTYYRRYLRDGLDVLDGLFDIFRNFIHKFVSDPQIGIGLIGIICIIITLIAVIKCREEINVSWTWFAYMAVLYFYLYNYVRMMCAVTLVVLGFTFIIRNKNKLALICMVIAVGFHFSAVSVLFMHLLITYFSKYRRIFICTGIIFLLLFINNPLLFFNVVKIGRYFSQIEFSMLSETNLGIGTFLRAMPIILIHIFYLKKFKSEKVFVMLFLYSWINVGVSIIGYYVGVASRLSNMYFIFHILFTVPWLLKRVKSSKEKYILKIYFSIYLLYYYYLGTGNFEAMMIVPYR